MRVEVTINNVLLGQGYRTPHEAIVGNGYLGRGGDNSEMNVRQGHFVCHEPHVKSPVTEPGYRKKPASSRFPRPNIGLNAVLCLAFLILRFITDSVGHLLRCIIPDELQVILVPPQILKNTFT
jgi:hypothetical protein